MARTRLTAKQKLQVLRTMKKMRELPLEFREIKEHISAEMGLDVSVPTLNKWFNSPTLEGDLVGQGEDQKNRSHTRGRGQVREAVKAEAMELRLCGAKVNRKALMGIMEQEAALRGLAPRKSLYPLRGLGLPPRASTHARRWL